MADDDDKSLELGGELGFLGPIPTGKLIAKYKKTWGGRDEKYVDDIADAADVPPAGIVERAEGNEALADLLLEGRNAAVQSNDAYFRERIARIVGSAVADEAKIDEMALLLRWVEDLTPQHLRVLVDLAATDWGQLDPGDPREAWITGGAVTLGLSRDFAEQILGDLESRGMLAIADLAQQFQDAKMAKDGETKSSSPLQPSSLAQRILDA